MFHIEAKTIYLVTILYFIEKCIGWNPVAVEDYKDTVKYFKCWFPLF